MLFNEVESTATILISYIKNEIFLRTNNCIYRLKYRFIYTYILQKNITPKLHLNNLKKPEDRTIEFKLISRSKKRKKKKQKEKRTCRLRDVGHGSSERKFFGPAMHPASSRRKKRRRKDLGAFSSSRAQPLGHVPSNFPFPLSPPRFSSLFPRLSFPLFRRHWPRHEKETARYNGCARGEPNGGGCGWLRCWIVKY